MASRYAKLLRIAGVLSDLDSETKFHPAEWGKNPDLLGRKVLTEHYNGRLEEISRELIELALSEPQRQS